MIHMILLGFLLAMACGVVADWLEGISPLDRLLDREPRKKKHG